MIRASLNQLWLPVLLLALSSCAPNPRIVAGSESDYLLQLRAEYLKSNPNGEYNEFIKRGEVVKGMDVVEVLASWGHPKIRTKFTDSTEEWTYREVDEQSKDWIDYTFTFRQGVLEEWELARHFAGGGSMNMPEGQSKTSLSKGAYVAGQQTETPKK